MGCTDRESNFNNFVYSNGSWGCIWGWDYTYTAPERRTIEEHLGESLAKYVLAFDGNKHQWVATPLQDREK
jgi:hypothetical protein